MGQHRTSFAPADRSWTVAANAFLKRTKVSRLERVEFNKFIAADDKLGFQHKVLERADRMRKAAAGGK